MLFGQVQAFIEVARTGNVSRAAEALYVTQPALTARIQSLEKELGEALFVRTGRGVRLTDAGRVFLPAAERAIQAVEDGRQALADLRSASAGRLALGAAPAVSTYVLPPVLKRFAAVHARGRGVAYGEGARQHRGRQEDGRGGPRGRAAAAGVGGPRDRQRLARPDRGRRRAADPAQHRRHPPQGRRSARRSGPGVPAGA